MILDNKGKLFGKISIVDIVIILVVLAVIGGAGWKFTRSNGAGGIINSKSDDIQLVFYSEEVPEYAAKAIKEGDIVSDNERKSVFGHVVGTPKIADAVVWAESDKGENVPAPKKGYVSISLTVEGKGRFNSSAQKNGVTFDNVDYLIGRTIYLNAGNSALSCRISEIKKKGS